WPGYRRSLRRSAHPTLPVYLSSPFHPETRGGLGHSTTIGNLGILVCFLVGSYVNWWWLAFVGAIIPMIFNYPHVLRARDSSLVQSPEIALEDAQASLEWLRGSASDVDFELDAIQRNYEIAKQESSSLKDLFRRQYAKPFLLAMGPMLFQQLSGINAVIFYTVSISRCQVLPLTTTPSTIIVGVVNLISTFLANVLIDRLGERSLVRLKCPDRIVYFVALGTFFYSRLTQTPLCNMNTK
ncbi:facilitated trehalose transporter Tret1-like, partial [Penaeus monodon]|uniref:facilitated trehalose transporter Tret1-like n=1 Tax=Penaeus monodon TaxID=6687 RepID=UPI0018A7740C